MKNDIVQREIRECDEVLVGRNEIILIQARPPLSAEEIACYGDEPEKKEPTWKAVLVVVSVWIFILYGFIKTVLR